MKLKVIIHEAEEGGYWAEVPAIPGCATQGETLLERHGWSLLRVHGSHHIYGKPGHVVRLSVPKKFRAWSHGPRIHVSAGQARSWPPEGVF